ncbi:hypothetical protein D3C83_129580 [compost metagenome]
MRTFSFAPAGFLASSTTSSRPAIAIRSARPKAAALRASAGPMSSCGTPSARAAATAAVAL